MSIALTDTEIWRAGASNSYLRPEYADPPDFYPLTDELAPPDRVILAFTIDAAGGGKTRIEVQIGPGDFATVISGMGVQLREAKPDWVGAYHEYAEHKNSEPAYRFDCG